MTMAAKKTLPKLYRLSDKCLALLTEKVLLRFNRAHDTIWRGGFDELNTIKTVKTLYSQLDGDARKLWRELYEEVYRYYRSQYEPGASGDVKARKSVDDILSSPDPLSRYCWDNEVIRKRDRCAEAVLSTADRESEKAWKTSLRLWVAATRLYTDSIGYRASIKAMRDAGVERVVWMTEDDGSVCVDCKPRHGKVYDIDKVPTKPHIGCRCYVQPVAKRK